MKRQRSEDQRKQQIREAAVRCFVRSGYGATRLLDIAREAGLSKGGIYFHYRAKDELFQDILDHHLQKLHHRWSFRPMSDAPADRTLAQLVIAHLRSGQENPDEIRLYNLLVTMAVQETSFREKLNEVFMLMQKLYAAVIRRGVAEGLFVENDPREMAVGVIAYLSGLSGYGSLDAKGKLPVLPERAAEQVLRMVGRSSSIAKIEFWEDSWEDEQARNKE